METSTPAPHRAKQRPYSIGLGLTLGWMDVGNDRDGRDETANFQLLNKIWCLKHDVSGEIVAVVGKLSHIWKTVVDPHREMRFTENAMKKLLNGSVPHKMGWRRGRVPAEWHQLSDGTSLVGLREQITAVQVRWTPTTAVLAMLSMRGNRRSSSC